MKNVQTIIDILHRRACETPDAAAYRFIQGASLSATELRYGELWLLVRRLADELQLRGLAGTQVLLVCRSQRNFVVSFFACLAAGVVAVPTALPRRKALIGRLRLLLDDAQVSAILSDADEVQGLAADEGAPSYVDLESWMQQQLAQLAPPVGAISAWRSPSAAGIAFLQYTSGSTGDPKGVVVTHANLISNSAVIQQAMGVSAASSVFTALPLFHDMGLVGGVLQPMFAGCVGHCMSPTEFVQYPERWLQFMSAFSISVSGGPNFMYELAARSITDEQIADCDLSHWKMAFCGAEPIRADTIKRFVSRFERFGFDASAFYPCYGMAESTLFIAGKARGQPLTLREHQGGTLVGCGLAFGDTELLIVDPDTRATLLPTETGEIWVRGTSVANGYWRHPELSAATFQARLAKDDGDSYLRTGDLGFICEGELYITSRLKDVIIMYGKKYSPQDLEAEAEASHEALGERGAAAFSFVREGRERVVVVAELRRTWLRRQEEWPHVVSAVRAAISVVHGLVVDEVVLIKPTTLPRTSSGKVRRAQCRSDYLAALLDFALPLEMSTDRATHDAVAHTID
jgi:acyl-CoA synthetase (AMP-forming)/AMP-acid ligase II